MQEQGGWEPLSIGVLYTSILLFSAAPIEFLAAQKMGLGLVSYLVNEKIDPLSEDDSCNMSSSWNAMVAPWPS